MKVIFITVFLYCVTLQSAIYDCFTFFNELELLQVRLVELEDKVDYFVIVEGTKTFSGLYKPLFFAENKQLFEKYSNKIIHVIVDDFPDPVGDPTVDNWNREKHQRNCILRGLSNCDRNDIIFISDVDEIIKSPIVDSIREYFKNNKKLKRVRRLKNQLICELHMRMFRYHLNREDDMGWLGAVKAAPYWIVKTKSPWDLKILHHIDRTLPKFMNAGWHFHAMGGKERWLMKFRSDSHQCEKIEFWERCSQNSQLLDEVYQKALSQYRVVPIDDSYPKYILDNLDYFRSLGWIVEED